MKNIAIIPTVRAPYKNQVEYCFDVNFSKLFKKVFKKVNIINISEDHQINRKIDLMVISGGNDIPDYSNKKQDIIRNQITKKYFERSKKLRIPILGICYGAQFVAKIYHSTFIKKKKVGEHLIFLNKDNFLNSKKQKFYNNSYKNILIKSVPKNVNVIATSSDNYIEAFYIKKIKFLGLQWHPERNKNLKKIDRDLLTTLL